MNTLLQDNLNAVSLSHHPTTEKHPEGTMNKQLTTILEFMYDGGWGSS